MLAFIKRYKALFVIGVIALMPLVLMAGLVLYGISFDQMIMFFGLVVNENSILLFAYIVFLLAMLLLLSMFSIMYVYMRDSARIYADRMMIEQPDRKEFWELIKKIVE